MELMGPLVIGSRALRGRMRGLVPISSPGAAGARGAQCGDARADDRAGRSYPRLASLWLTRSPAADLAAAGYGAVLGRPRRDAGHFANTPLRPTSQAAAAVRRSARCGRVLVAIADPRALAASVRAEPGGVITCSAGRRRSDTAPCFWRRPPRARRRRRTSMLCPRHSRSLSTTASNGAG